MDFGNREKNRPYDIMRGRLHYRGLHTDVSEQTDRLSAIGLRPLNLAKIDRTLVLHTIDSTPVSRVNESGLWHSLYVWTGSATLRSLPDVIDGMSRLVTGSAGKRWLRDIETPNEVKGCGAAIQLVSLWVDPEDAADLAGDSVSWLLYSISSDPDQPIVGLFSGQESEYARIHGSDCSPANLDAAGEAAVLAELSDTTLISLFRNHHPGVWMRASPKRKRKLIRELRDRLLKDRAKHWN